MRSLMALTALGLSLPSVGYAQTIALSGSCPTDIDINIAGLTPGGRYAVLDADTAGSGVVPTGPCAGLSTGLDAASQQLLAVPTADNRGRLDLAGVPVAPSLCGRTFSVVDLGACSTSNVEVMPAAGTGASLTTYYNASMNLPAGSVMYLDLDADRDLFLTGLEVVLLNPSLPGAMVNVYQRSGTWMGNENSAAGWTLAAVGTVPMGTTGPGWSQVMLSSPVPVSAGRTALMLEYVGSGQRFSDGLFPVGRELASDGILTIYEGGAGDAPFAGLCCAPRVWNGTIFYTY